MGEADRKPEAVKGNPARRAAAAAEYQRLSQEGAPPGTRSDAHSHVTRPPVVPAITQHVHLD